MSTSIILAIESPRAELHLADAPPLRALIEIEGRPAITHVLRQVRSLAFSKTMVLTTFPDEVQVAVSEFQGVEVKKSPGFSSTMIRQVLGELPPDDPIVVVNGDLPWVLAAEIGELLGAAAETPDLFLSMVDTRALPGHVKKQSASFQEGTYCPGRAFAAVPRILLQGAALERVEALSVSPFELLKSLGPGFLFKLGLGMFSMGEFETELAKQLALPIQLLLMNTPGFARNLSNPEDLRA